MKAISGKQLARLLEERGWSLARISGSHHIFAKSGSQVRLTVPIHGNRTLKLGLQRHLMKLARIDEAELCVLPFGTASRQITHRPPAAFCVA